MDKNSAEQQNLHNGHRERLRRKFIDFGADALLEHEITELILFYAIPRMNTNETAHILVNEFKNSGGVLSASPQELIKIKGIGQSSVEFIKFLSDVCNEYSTFQALPDNNNTADVNSISEYFRDYFIDTNKNVCLIQGLNIKFQIQGRISFTKESLIKDDREIKRIVEFLLKNNCERIIVGVNHAEKRPIPDNSDFYIIKLLAEKLSALNIILSDCIICSNNGTYSLKQKGAFSFEEY